MYKVFIAQQQATQKNVQTFCIKNCTTNKQRRYVSSTGAMHQGHAAYNSQPVRHTIAMATIACFLDSSISIFSRC